MVRSLLFHSFYFFALLIISNGCTREVENIERPEKIVSMREVVYTQETYTELAELWEEYYNQFPSEDAYANWMYAYRYSKKEGYNPLLDKGIEKYPGNPTLLYLGAIVNHGVEYNNKNISMLEKAVELDPTYLDPWFALVINYMANKDEVKLKEALNNLLAGGAVSDEILDYNYNVLSLLEKNSILITNGDNDTFPAWILTEILKFRPDVKIVNRSLLNTKWYPNIIMDTGVLEFISESKLKVLRTESDENIKTKKMEAPKFGPYCDTLITKIVEKASEVNTPVYFASTVYYTDQLERYKDKGRNLGLVTLVTPTKMQYPEQVKDVASTWLNNFRTGGMNSWTLLHSNKSNSGKRLLVNYARALNHLIEPITKYAPSRKLELFYWYQNNLYDLLSSMDIDKFNSMWCKSNDIKEISDWCKRKNILE